MSSSGDQEDSNESNNEQTITSSTQQDPLAAACEPPAIAPTPATEGDQLLATSPSDQHQGDPSKTSCLRAACYHVDQKRLDLYVLLCHIGVVLLCGAIALIVRYDQKYSKGVCLLAADFNKGGDVIFSKVIYWCNMVLYNVMLSAAVAVSCISTKWIGQLFSYHKWLKVEFVVVCLVVILCCLSIVTLYTYRLTNWCSELSMARQSDVPGQSVDTTSCGTRNETRVITTRCQCDARYIDETYNKMAGDVQMEGAYKFAVAQLVMMYAMLVVWLLTILLMYKRYRMAYNARQAWIREVEEKCRRAALTEMNLYQRVALAPGTS